MTEITPEPLHHRTFVNRTLQGSRFVGCDLSEVVVRGSELAGMELDSPWLLEGGSTLLVNGIDVVPLVDAELNRRFPGRELRTATDPDGLRAAWAAVEGDWAATLVRAQGLPSDTLDASVDGEWSFAQTLRHLIMATDVWLGRAILERERPYAAIGLPNTVTRRPPTSSTGSPPRYPSSPRSSACGPNGRAWSGTSSPRSPRTSWPPRAGTRMPPSIPKPFGRAWARSWKRSGSTTVTRCATWTSWRNRKRDPAATWAIGREQGHPGGLRFSVEFVDTTTQPRVTAAGIRAAGGVAPSYLHVRLSGPDVMLGSLRAGLLAVGVPEQNITLDSFSLR